MKLPWTILYSDKALMSFHHDASNSHVPNIKFLEFSVHALLLTSHHRQLIVNLQRCLRESWLPIVLQQLRVNMFPFWTPVLRRVLKITVACPPVNSAFFSGMGHQFFLLFCTMVDNQSVQKRTESFFQENSFLPKFMQKGPKMFLKQGFLDFLSDLVKHKLRVTS